MLLTEMIGAPFPAETSITAAGVAWGQGLFSFVPLYVAVVLANICGSSISFAIGHYLGRPFLKQNGRLLRLTEDRIAKIERNFQRNAAVLILFGKFVSIVRVLVPPIAGMNGMRFLTFSAYNTVSALIWGALFLIEGRYLDKLWHHATFWQSGLAAGILLGGILTVFIVRRLLSPSQ